MYVQIKLNSYHITVKMTKQYSITIQQCSMTGTSPLSLKNLQKFNIAARFLCSDIILWNLNSVLHSKYYGISCLRSTIIFKFGSF